MKKFLLGAAAGLAVYKIVRSRGLKKRVKARISMFGTAVFERSMDKLYDRAIKNGVTDQEITELIRIVTKATK